MGQAQPKPRTRTERTHLARVGLGPFSVIHLIFLYQNFLLVVKLRKRQNLHTYQPTNNKKHNNI